MQIYQKKFKSEENKFTSVVLIFIVFLTFYFRIFKMPPIDYWDEHVWISQGFYLELFIRGDFKNKLWNGLYSYDEPKLVPYLYALLFYPDYLNERKSKNKNYDYIKYLIDRNFYWDYNFFLTEGEGYKKYLTSKKDSFVFWKSIKSFSPEEIIKKYGKGFEKTLQMIYKARFLSAIFLSLTVALVQLITQKLISKPYSYLVTLLFGINSVNIYTGLKATSETTFTFFLTLGLYFILSIFNNTKRDIWILILFAVTCALAAQTKLNGIVLLIIFNIIFTLYLIKPVLKKEFNLLKKYFFQLAFVNCLTFIVFVFLHPLLYSNPIKNSLFIYQFRYRGALAYQKEFPREALVNIPARFNRIYQHFYKHVETNYGLPYIFFQRNFIDYGNRVIFRLVKIIIKIRLAFLIVGFFALLHKNLFDWREFFSSNQQLLKPVSILFSSFLILFILILFYLLMDWMPYYIALIFPIIFIEIFGFSYIMRFALNFNKIAIENVHTFLFQKKSKGKKD